MTIGEKILDLCKELRQEAYFEGNDTGLYNHTTTFHTVERREQMLNHKKIQDRILEEIKDLLDPKKVSG